MTYGNYKIQDILEWRAAFNDWTIIRCISYDSNILFYGTGLATLTDPKIRDLRNLELYFSLV